MLGYRLNGKDLSGKNSWWALVLEAFKLSSPFSILQLDTSMSDGFELSALRLSEIAVSSSLEAFSGHLLVESLTSESGLWVLGSIPFCMSFFLMEEFHRFFISLSVLPGNCAAIRDHLLPRTD